MYGSEAPYTPDCKIIYAYGRHRLGIVVNEVDAPLRQIPTVRIHPSVEYQCFWPAPGRHSPNTPFLSIIITTVVYVSIGRFPGHHAPVPGDLDCLSSIGRHLPDLPAPAPVRAEIDPAAIP